MNGILLKEEGFSRGVNLGLAMIEDEASFEIIFDDLQQFGKEEPAGGAEQQDAGDLLSDAEKRWPLRLELKKKKKQFRVNHTQEGIGQGRQTAGQVKGEQ
jgi:hypothetical protein